MDRVRVELLTPLTIEELHREARRVALADAAPDPGRGAVLAARVGSFLVRVGHRLEAMECRRPVTVSLPAVTHWVGGD